MKSWKRRFFVMKDQRLYYFKDSSASSRPQGMINLLGCVADVIDDKELMKKVDKRSLSLFRIAHRDEIAPAYLLCASNEDEMVEWTNSILKEACKAELQQTEPDRMDCSSESCQRPSCDFENNTSDPIKISSNWTLSSLPNEAQKVAERYQNVKQRLDKIADKHMSTKGSQLYSELLSLYDELLALSKTFHAEMLPLAEDYNAFSTALAARVNKAFDMKENGKRSAKKKKPLSGCPRCNREMAGMVVDAGTESYHLECFTCASCRDRLKNTFVHLDKCIMCEACARTHVKKNKLKL